MALDKGNYTLGNYFMCEINFLSKMESYTEKHDASHQQDYVKSKEALSVAHRSRRMHSKSQ